MTKYFKQEAGEEMTEITFGQVTDSLPRKEVISIQPGDVVVLTNPYGVSMEQQDLAEADLKRMFPDNESLFLSNGVTLEVYREQGKPSGNKEVCDSHRGDCSKCDEECKYRIHDIGGGVQ